MKTPRLLFGLLALGMFGVSTAATLAATDYTISISGGVLTVTNNTNHADNLKFNEPSPGNISFTATGRTFDNNGASTTLDNSAATLLSGLTSIVINGGSGGETFSIGDYSDVSAFPSLTINGGTGNDTVTFTGKITFASDRNLSVNLQSGSGSHGVDNINVTGAQLVASGNGTIDLECSQSVAIASGAVVKTAKGNLTVMANQQTTATAGNFYGVNIDGAGTKVQSTGSGVLTVNGTGGNSGDLQLGVNVSGGAQIIGGNDVNVTGTGGASSGTVNRGVTVYGAGSAIVGGGGKMVFVTGTAGAQGSGFGIGVSVLYGGKISAGSFTSVTGTGGGASGGANQGVEIGGAATPASTITDSAGAVNITADAGPGASVGLFMSDAAAVGPAPGIYLNIDSVSLDNTVSLTATNLSFAIQVSTRSATRIDLGGNNAQGTLGFTTAELARLSGTLLFESGDITLSAPVTQSSAGDLFLYLDTGGLHATASGTEVSLANGTFYLNGPGPLNMPITGPAPDTDFPQLNVSGSISIGNNTAVPLNLAGTTFAGTAGQKFTILKNNGATAISGTFQNLPEGATTPWPGSPLYNAKISYVGGSGHDVVLTLVNATTPSPTPSPTPTSTPTATPTSTPTASPTSTPTASPTSTSTSTPTATPTPSSTPGLVGNVSTRLPVGTGDNALIEGFIVQGPGGSTKKILVRAIGPSLLPFGIADALANPTLEIHDSTGAIVATNDDWNTTEVGGLITSDQTAEITASQVAPSNGLESAIIADLAPDSYTAVVRGLGDTTGTGVVDAYDLSAGSPAELANIATRGLIQPGDKLMIAGFIVQSAPVRVVVRAIGPSLAAFGITNALPDTTLQLHDQDGAIVREDDDWQSDQKVELEATGLQPSDPLEAAIIVTIPPGQYTAQVRGKPETTGTGVVQVYFLQ